MIIDPMEAMQGVVVALARLQALTLAQLAPPSPARDALIAELSEDMLANIRRTVAECDSGELFGGTFVPEYVRRLVAMYDAKQVTS